MGMAPIHSFYCTQDRQGPASLFRSEESDVFVLSGEQDLVPWFPEVKGDRIVGADMYSVRRYRPRIEGLFAPIERWTRKSDGDRHWRSISRENVTTLYGKTSKSRIANPANPSQVFSWLICETYDDKGNAILYRYKPEDASDISLFDPSEKNRLADGRFAQR